MSKLSDTFRRRAAKPKDGAQTTALHLAVAEKNIQAVREMLAQGNEDLFAPDAQNRTPLIIAVENNDLETAALLLDYDRSGIDLSADHGTALMIAAGSGFLDMAQLLVDVQKEWQELNIFRMEMALHLEILVLVLLIKTSKNPP